MTMNGHGKSDSPILPGMQLNNGSHEPAEVAEGRGLAKGNPPQGNRCRTLCRDADHGHAYTGTTLETAETDKAGPTITRDLQQALERIRCAAAKDRQLRFTALWHHVYTIDGLREAYFNLKRKSAPGLDGQTWQEYGTNLEANLQDLSDRLRRGAYRARPVRRVFIPKPDGRQRPIGVPTLEDKIVQRATARVLEGVYEVDFKGFSYGFRPGRSPHLALDALAMGIKTQRVNWVLNVDIRGFYDAMSHEWTMKFVEHRIADQRVLRHIKKWLAAGVLEDGNLTPTEEGTPQGGSISPLLSNVYLNYAFDLWADHWRRRTADGQVVMVRFADDIVMGFQHRSDAEQFLHELKARFRKFNLELHPEKTRLIEFGRFAAERRQLRGEGKPETFDFLGFTHICSKTKRNGRFFVYRRPMARRMAATLKAIKETLLRCRHALVADQGRWLRSVVRGWYQYFAVPFTLHTLYAFRRIVARHWFRALRRRSQRSSMTWRRMYRLTAEWLPQPRIKHPYPWERVPVIT